MFSFKKFQYTIWFLVILGWILYYVGFVDNLFDPIVELSNYQKIAFLLISGTVMMMLPSILVECWKAKKFGYLRKKWLTIVRSHLHVWSIHGSLLLFNMLTGMLY